MINLANGWEIMGWKWSFIICLEFNFWGNNSLPIVIGLIELILRLKKFNSLRNHGQSKMRKFWNYKTKKVNSPNVKIFREKFAYFCAFIFKKSLAIMNFKNSSKKYKKREMSAQIRDCVWAPIRRDTMAKVNKAKLVGEDTVLYTEVFHFWVILWERIGVLGWQNCARNYWHKWDRRIGRGKRGRRLFQWRKYAGGFSAPDGQAPSLDAYAGLHKFAIFKRKLATKIGNLGAKKPLKEL